MKVKYLSDKWSPPGTLSLQRGPFFYQSGLELLSLQNKLKINKKNENMLMQLNRNQ